MIAKQQSPAELREELERLKFRLTEYDTIFESMPIMFWYKDAHNHLLRLNRAAAELESAPKASLEGKHCEDLYPAEQAAAFYADDLEVLESGQPKLNIVEPHTAPGSGETRWLQVGKVPTFDDAGTVNGIVVFATDITQQVKSEAEQRQAQKMESIGRLAGGIAHDFNNLLGAIMGAAELIQSRSPLREDTRTDLNHIVRATEQAAALTGQLLAFSRKSNVNPTPCDVFECLDKVLAIVTRTTDPRIVIKQRRSGASAMLMAQAGSVQSAILNLVLNAQDAMPNGGVLHIITRTLQLREPLEMSHSEVLAPGDYVALCIRDTGVGIPEEGLPHIFEPFFTTKEVGKGTGLGLAAVYGSAQLYGGGVSVTSQVGIGSEFTLYLPINPALRRPTTEPQRGPTRGQGTILVADDEPALRRFAKQALEQAGYRVVVAKDGTEALNVASELGAQLDLAVLDVTMPGLSGPEVLARLRETQPEFRAIFVTGYDFTRSTNLTDADVPVVLEKPYRASTLTSAVSQLLGS